jgi:hypothetical protein
MHRVMMMVVVMTAVGERRAGTCHAQGQSDGERRGNACEQFHSSSNLTIAARPTGSGPRTQ